MISLLATIKPASARGWNRYARILLEEKHHQAGGVEQTGVWKHLNGPFFPFSKDTPQAKSGTWEWDESSRQIYFWASEEYGQTGIMIFGRVPVNFRIVCSQRDVTGGGTPHGNWLYTLPSERLVWVMGPASGRAKKPVQQKYVEKSYRAVKTNLPAGTCSPTHEYCSPTKGE
jgi:hypothetical protein